MTEEKKKHTLFISSNKLTLLHATIHKYVFYLKEEIEWKDYYTIIPQNNNQIIF